MPSDGVVILQYSPFSYARWGLAPWLPALLLALRMRAKRPLIVLNVHEPYVPMSSPRSVAMGLWQRVQLAALQLGSDVVFSSIESWARALSKRWPRAGSIISRSAPTCRTCATRERRNAGAWSSEAMA